MLKRLFDSRLWALIVKEMNQILHNRSLIVILLFPPTVQLLVYGYALNPDVHGLRLGVMDYAQTQISRELVAAFTENKTFVVDRLFLSETDLAHQLETGQLDAGVIIPPEFSRHLTTGIPTDIQLLLDGVNANTAGLASGYLNQMVRQFSLTELLSNFTLPIATHVTFFYNPGLVSSWFFVPGVMGLVITLIGSIVSAVTLVKEKDAGTLEQLLMTPAADWEILLSKIVPIFLLLMGDIFLALGLARGVFGVPFRGNFLLFIGLSGLYVFVGISVGILLATICQSQQQVVLTTFFINLPMVQLSGAIAPVETMPDFFQYLSWLNPLRHFVSIMRGILLKGVGLEALWLHTLALGCFVVVLFSISVHQFRRQLT